MYNKALCKSKVVEVTFTDPLIYEDHFNLLSLSRDHKLEPNETVIKRLEIVTEAKISFFHAPHEIRI